MSDTTEEQGESFWSAALKSAQEYVAEHGPLPPEPPLRFENDPFFFNLFACLTDTLQPGDPPEQVDFTAELAGAQGFTCEICSCLLTPLGGRRASLTPIIPPHGAEEAPSRLKYALAYAFTAWGCDELVVACAADLPHVRDVLTRLGFTLQFNRDDAIERASGRVALEHYRLTLDEWIPANQLLLERRETYDADWAAKDSPDKLQAAYIGFVALCIDQGDAARGVEIYNRWSAWVGLGSIELKAAPSVLVESASSAKH